MTEGRRGIWGARITAEIDDPSRTMTLKKGVGLRAVVSATEEGYSCV